MDTVLTKKSSLSKLQTAEMPVSCAQMGEGLLETAWWFVLFDEGLKSATRIVQKK